MAVELVLQLTALRLCICSLEPDEYALEDIKGINTAGQIPYQDARQNQLFVVKVEVERPKRRRRISKKAKAKAKAKGKGKGKGK